MSLLGSSVVGMRDVGSQKVGVVAESGKRRRKLQAWSHMAVQAGAHMCDWL